MDGSPRSDEAHKESEKRRRLVYIYIFMFGQLNKSGRELNVIPNFCVFPRFVKLKEKTVFDLSVFYFENRNRSSHKVTAKRK